MVGSSGDETAEDGLEAFVLEERGISSSRKKKQGVVVILEVSVEAVGRARRRGRALLLGPREERGWRLLFGSWQISTGTMWIEGGKGPAVDELHLEELLLGHERGDVRLRPEEVVGHGNGGGGWIGWRWIPRWEEAVGSGG